jgi:hypothetical protein
MNSERKHANIPASLEMTHSDEREETIVAQIGK